MWLEIVKLALPDWNTRTHTAQDFDSFCVDEHLKVVEMESGEWGFYTVHQGQPFIVLDPNMKGGFRLWVSWHEAAHHLLHIPETDFFTLQASKNDWQANVVAACALIPITLLKQKSIWEIREEFDYPIPLCFLRLMVYDRMKF